MTHIALVVGESRDLHVRAVLGQMRTEPVVLDAESLRANAFLLDESGLALDGATVSPTRGWLRRLAPPGWLEQADDPGIRGAIRSSYLAVLSAVLRSPDVDWLSSVDSIGSVENKAVQYRLASRAGCPVPDWLVTTDPQRAPDTGDWVAKPLGPGYYQAEDGPRVVPVSRYRPEQRRELEGAAFLLQRRIEANLHARVVTVRGRALSATLPGSGLPLDWRQEPNAHTSFIPYEDQSLSRLALLAASACGVRYSSQDWIRDPAGQWWFVDLNPGGQWLFLPDPVSRPVTAAIAGWLDGED